MLILLHNIYVDFMHNTFVPMNLVHNTLVDPVCIIHQQMRCGTELGAWNGPNVRGGSTTLGMKKHRWTLLHPWSIWLGKLWTTTWA